MKLVRIPRKRKPTDPKERREMMKQLMKIHEEVLRKLSDSDKTK